MPSTFLVDKVKQATIRKTQTISERTVFPILPAKVLLSTLQRQKWIEDIQELVNAPTEYFAALYQQLIENYVMFVQALPVNNESRLSSLIDEGLLRALYILRVQKQETSGEKDPLITYVLFSAALMFDIGFVTSNRSIMISNKQGEFIKQWWPHTGAMQLSDGYYKIRRGGGMPAWLSRRVAVLFAYQLMPQVGFDWIAKDAYALNTWIALLNNEQEGLDALKMYFDRSVEMLNDFKAREIFMALNIETITNPAETALGEDFLEWLQQGLQDGTIKINTMDASVQMLKNGMLLETPAIFKEFSKNSPNHPNWQTVYDQFKKLGILGATEQDIKTGRYFYTAKATEGFAKTAAQQFGKTSLFSHESSVVGTDAAKTEGKQLATKAAILPVDKQIAQVGLKEGVIIGYPLMPLVIASTYLPSANTNLMPATDAQQTQSSNDQNRYPSLQEMTRDIQQAQVVVHQAPSSM